MKFKFLKGLYNFDIVRLCNENFFFILGLFIFLFIVVHALLMYLNNFYKQRIKILTFVPQQSLIFIKF